jgi:hypothetical protein
MKLVKLGEAYVNPDNILFIYPTKSELSTEIVFCTKGYDSDYSDAYSITVPGSIDDVAKLIMEEKEDEA